MSYILDAIKKTESGQKDGDVPNLNSEHHHSTVMDEPESKKGLIAILSIIALLISVVIVLLIKSVSTPSANDLSLANQVVTSQAKADQAPPQSDLERREDMQSPASIQNTDMGIALETKTDPQQAAEQPLESVNNHGLIIKKSPLEVQQPVVVKQPISEPVAKQVEVVSRRPVTENVEPESQSASRLVRSNDKPQFLAAIDHDHWPTLIYTTHIYATQPEDRFVMLNGKAYSIGDTIAKGLVIEDILENDLLISDRGQKVLVPSLTDVNP